MRMTFPAPRPPDPSPLTHPVSGTLSHTSHARNGPPEASVGRLLYGSLVGDVMTRDVVTIAPEANLRTAALLLSHKRISGMPVVDPDGRVRGVLSEKDIVRLLHQSAGLGLPGGMFELLLEPSGARQKDMMERCRHVLEDTQVKTAMTAPAQTTSPSTPTVDAIRQMLDAHINRLPVVENGRLVGIVTRRDLLSAHLEMS